MQHIETGLIQTKVPARLDRLPWSRWHWLVVIGLGTVWILDGLEVTIVSAVAGRLTEPGSGLELTASQIGLAGAIYIAGACSGALFFGYLTDRFGRKKLFLITLVLYLAATTLTAFATGPGWFYLFRFLTGAGIGGEYAAINSAIDELVPARVRGRVALFINGSYWVGTAFGAGLAMVLLDTDVFAVNVGWRLAFGLGAILGLGILIVRRHVPESPRWLFTHGRAKEAEMVVDRIEQEIEEQTGRRLPEPQASITVRQRESIGFITIAKTMFKVYPQRSLLCFSLFTGQAFLYNAVFFTYVLVLTVFYDVAASDAPLYLIPFAIGNFMGPLLLGPLFDTIGRRRMIAGTYILSGVLLTITGYLFAQGLLTAFTQTLAWMVIFFFASAGASAAYLTSSEIFPMEIRALAIAFFFAIGTAVGGISGPLVFGALIDTARAADVFIGYLIGSALMITAGLVEAWIGVDAEGKSLEDIARPLAAEGDMRPLVAAGLG
ncbi:MAG: MFS transporter [Pseudomonadota bacterium]|nr:MFS transporter [Pseudomonadota bacterium]